MNTVSLFLCVMVVEPIGEWIIHFLLHLYFDPKGEHKYHHDQIDKEKKVQLNYPILAMFTGATLFAPELIYLLAMLIRYEVGHYLIHSYPEIFITYASHHREHHRCDISNYGITAIWPDILFSTWREEFTAVSEYRVAQKIYNWRDSIPIKKRSVRWAL